MKISAFRKQDRGGSAMLGYLFIALIIMATVAALGTLVVQNLNFAQRRQNIVNARQMAQAGAAICATEVEQAFTNGGGGLVSNLTATLPRVYAVNSSLSSASQLVYERTITDPFTNQTILAQVWITNSTTPQKVKCLAKATVGQTSQSSEINMETIFGVAAAIISTATGDLTTGTSKSDAQNGNVVVVGSSKGLVKVDGGIDANGTINTNACLVDSVEGNLYASAGQLPDYTNPGSPKQLFDFNRYIAVADKSGNHYTNFASFAAAAGVASKANPLQGIVVVDFNLAEKSKISLDPSTFPNGICVQGTLVVNYVGGWSPTDKVINTADMYINWADLSKMNPNDPSTYPSGYPPTYTNPAKNPILIDISAKFPNFTAADDLPAYMYNNAILDMHGNINVCGAVYSPCYMEIENKQAGQIQYIKGAIIGGGGIYMDNVLAATNVVSYDAKALRNLATSANNAKAVKVTYYR
jgi:hypothetical protein